MVRRLRTRWIARQEDVADKIHLFLFIVVDPDKDVDGTDLKDIDGTDLKDIDGTDLQRASPVRAAAMFGAAVPRVLIATRGPRKGLQRV